MPSKQAVSRQAPQPQINPSLALGYDALNRGDDASAKVAYEQAHECRPQKSRRTAGLAAVHLRQGRPELAAEYYLRVLESDPKNATAQAGLINLQGRMDPVQAESRLRQSCLSMQPDSPALNFSLGNTYARNKRWTEAQQAYFKAMAGDPGNPDYLFNLAISLDQMHQSRLAANYYNQAIAAAEPGRPDLTSSRQANDCRNCSAKLP